MSFLIIDSDQSYSNKLALALSQEFESEIHIREDSNDAIALIELLDDFHFVIAVKSEKEDDLADKIVSRLEEEDIHCRPNILLIGGSLSCDVTTPPLCLPITVKAKEVLQIIKNQKKFQENIKSVEMEQNKDYQSIPLRLFSYMESLPGDAYIKMKKDGNLHYLKRFSKADTINQEDLSKLSDKGVRFLHINKEEKISFFNYLDQMIAKLAKKNPDTFENESDLENYAFHSLHNVGVSESSLMVAKEALKGFQAKISSDRAFQNNLKDILKNKKLGLKQLNSKVLSLIANFIVKGSELESSKALDNIVMASYLQDIKLDNEQCSIRTESELQSLLLNDRDNVLIDQHAKNAADELEKFATIPSDVVKIVRQHHGSIDGRGFPYKLASTLHPQAIVFLLAEEVSLSILKSERNKISFIEILDALMTKYEQSGLLQKHVDNLIKNLSSK